MPMYAYKCDKCGRAVDLIRKIAERNDGEPCQVEVPSKGIAKALGRKSAACKGTLVRDESEEINAKMGHRWQP